MSEVSLGLVKPPQSKRGRGLSMVHLANGAAWGKSGQRVYVKTQRDYDCRPAWRGWRLTPTFVCEHRALQACRLLGLPVPEVVSLRMEEGVAELILGEIEEALSLREFFEYASDERFAAVLNRVGYLVGLLHGAGWIHGALGSAHILIQKHKNDGVWLIDLEKARRTRSKRRLQADLDRLWHRQSYLQPHHIEAFMTAYWGTQTHKPSQADLAIS
jgi:tRNA A-37 threonylcarbamoyl transferase component Bud32